MDFGLFSIVRFSAFNAIQIMRYHLNWVIWDWYWDLSNMWYNRFPIKMMKLSGKFLLRSNFWCYIPNRIPNRGLFFYYICTSRNTCHAIHLSSETPAMPYMYLQKHLPCHTCISRNTCHAIHESPETPAMPYMYLQKHLPCHTCIDKLNKHFLASYLALIQ